MHFHLFERCARKLHFNLNFKTAVYNDIFRADYFPQQNNKQTISSLNSTKALVLLGSDRFIIIVSELKHSTKHFNPVLKGYALHILFKMHKMVIENCTRPEMTHVENCC